MPGPSIPKPLAGLLGKLGPRGQGGASGAQGLRGDGAREGPAKGAELGPDGELLAGVGYGLKDGKGPRNISERANMNRFLSEMGKDAGAFFEASAEAPAEGPGSERASAEGGELREGPAEARDKGEAREGAEAREADEAPAAPGERIGEAAPEKEAAEAPPSEGEAHAEDEEGDGGQSGGEDPDDEEERPGAGWLAEEAEEREKRRRFQVDGADPLGATHRCRGHLEDGTRCLRKPLEGTPYCREHRSD